MDPTQYALNQNPLERSSFINPAQSLLRSDPLAPDAETLQLQYQHQHQFAGEGAQSLEHPLLREQVAEQINTDWRYDPGSAEKPQGPEELGPRASEGQTVSSRLVSVFVLLLLSVCCGLLGPFYLLADIARPILRACWRQQLATLLFVPMIFVDKRQRVREFELQFYAREVLLNRESLVVILQCAVFFSLWMSCFSISIDTLHVSAAYALCNSYPLILVLLKRVKRSRLALEEYVGSAFVVVGAFFIVKDQHDNLYAALLAVLGGIFAALYYRSSVKIKENYYPWMVAVTLISLLSSGSTACSSRARP